MVLRCDFSGSIAPEIGKIRPVVVITPHYVQRYRLCAVVPLSTRRPAIALAYHVRLHGTPFPGAALEQWAKCDLATSVSHARLDRIPAGASGFVVGAITPEELAEIYAAVAFAFGVDPRVAHS